MLASRANQAGRRRGGVLFEVVLAVALFGGAAAFTLAAVRSVFATLDQTRRRQEAVDLARSKLAELEAGLINLADLRGGGGAGHLDAALPDEINSPSASRASAGPAWLFDLKTSRTEFTGLSLVELTVFEDHGPAADSSDGIGFTLRQLMPLREADPEEYRPDELVEGIDE